MIRYYSHECPVCGNSVLPKCFKPREDMTETEWDMLIIMIDRKLAVHMITEHPDEFDNPTMA